MFIYIYIYSCDAFVADGLVVDLRLPQVEKMEKKNGNSSWFGRDHVARGSSSCRAAFAAARPIHFSNGLGCIVYMCV